ncbi:MAG: hypothetical protein AAF471_09230, partial [Myxococcota bacterium]
MKPHFENDAVALARRIGDPKLLARAVTRFFLGMFLAEPPEAIARRRDVVDEAIARGGDLDPVSRAWLLAGRTILTALSGGEGAREEAERAWEAAETSGNAHCRVVALSAHFAVLRRPEDTAHRLRVTDQLVEEATTLGHPELLARAHHSRVQTRLGGGDMAGAEADLASMETIAEAEHN